MGGKCIRTPEQGALINIIQRCTNPNNPQYSSYGGRGITVCDRWRHSFENFLADMGPRPSDKHSIDRIDNDGNYEPGNCRWATQREQCRNKRSNRIIEFDGVRLPVVDWAERLGVPVEMLRGRIKQGWSDEAIIATPRQHSPPRKEKYEFNGESHTIIEWSKITGINRKTLQARLFGGWPIAVALTSPPTPTSENGKKSGELAKQKTHESTCIVCGQRFKTNMIYRERAKYCSRPCYNKVENSRRTERRRQQRLASA